MRLVFLTLRRIEATVLSLAMIAIAAVTIANVFARNVFGGNLAAAEELNQLLIVLICFVGLSHAASQGRHIRMTALYDLLGRRQRKVLMCAITATTAALMFTLAWFAASYAGSVDRVSPVLGVPLGLVYMAAPLGFVLAGLQYALALGRNLTDPAVWVAYDVTDRYDVAAEAPGLAAEGTDAGPAVGPTAGRDAETDAGPAAEREAEADAEPGDRERGA